MSLLRPMENIDSFLKDKIQNLKELSDYQRFDDFYSNLEEDKQIITKSIATVLALAIPAIIICSFWIYSNSVKSELATKIELYQTAQDILIQNESFSGSNSQVFGQSYESQNSFQSALSQELQKNGIDIAAVAISNYNSDEITNTLIEITSSLKVSNFSNEQLFNFINILTVQMKAKIEQIKISKDEKSNLLNGVVDISHLSQNLSEGL